METQLHAKNQKKIPKNVIERKKQDYSMISSPEKKLNKTQYDWFRGKSQNSKKLKRREICHYFWKIEAKNSQKGQHLVKNGEILNIFEFPRHAGYDFSKKTIRTASIPKTRKIHSGVWKL